jgi:hypothetical protein
LHLPEFSINYLLTNHLPIQFRRIFMHGATTFLSSGSQAGAGLAHLPIPGHAGVAASTAILTTEGEVLVEHLAPGDTAVLAGGGNARILFIGRHKLNLARHQNPAKIRPVRIQPGALGGGRPARQLTVAPDLAVCIGDVLIAAKNLIDNATIFQDNAVAEIEYFTIELAAPGILLAEGAAAESCGDASRETFAAPLCQAGPTLAAIRARLAARRRGFGLAAAETLALAARAAGRVLPPILNTSREAIFAIPRGATELLVTTPIFTPADFDPTSTDRRAVGLALAAIVIDGQTKSPESVAVSGLHPRAAHDPHAWTTGKLRLKLPKNAERVTLHIATRPKTWHFNPKAA